jgi:hypothetical protein
MYIIQWQGHDRASLKFIIDYNNQRQLRADSHELKGQTLAPSIWCHKIIHLSANQKSQYFWTWLPSVHCLVRSRLKTHHIDSDVQLMFHIKPHNYHCKLSQLTWEQDVFGVFGVCNWRDGWIIRVQILYGGLSLQLIDGNFQ